MLRATWAKSRGGIAAQSGTAVLMPRSDEKTAGGSPSNCDENCAACCQRLHRHRPEPCLLRLRHRVSTLGVREESSICYRCPGISHTPCHAKALRHSGEAAKAEARRSTSDHEHAGRRPAEPGNARRAERRRRNVMESLTRLTEMSQEAQTVCARCRLGGAPTASSEESSSALRLASASPFVGLDFQQLARSAIDRWRTNEGI